LDEFMTSSNSHKVIRQSRRYVFIGDKWVHLTAH
jgi:hypothetical protein